MTWTSRRKIWDLLVHVVFTIDLLQRSHWKIRFYLMNDILPSCKHDLDIISREISYLDTDNVYISSKEHSLWVNKPRTTVPTGLKLFSLYACANINEWTLYPINNLNQLKADWKKEQFFQKLSWLITRIV